MNILLLWYKIGFCQRQTKKFYFKYELHENYHIGSKNTAKMSTVTYDT